MEQNNLLSCRDLSLGYEQQALVEHLSLDVPSGDYLCVMGENGSGKSTFLKSVLGLLKPLSGEIVRSDALKLSGIGMRISPLSTSYWRISSDRSVDLPEPVGPMMPSVCPWPTRKFRSVTFMKCLL